MRALVVLSCAVAAGCGIEFERASEVLDRRVLALSAEPPELVLDGSGAPGPVVVRALVGDAGGLDAPVAYEWRTCVPTGAGSSGGYDSAAGRCDVTTPSTLAAAGTLPLDALALEVAIPEPVQQAMRGLAAQGQPISLYVDAQLKLAAEPEALFALKRIVLSPPVPAGRRANRNPRLAAVLLDGEPWEPGVPRRMKFHACEEKVTAVDPSRRGVNSPTCEHRIDPVFDAAEAEPYRVQTFDRNPDGTPATLDLQERLRFSWFANRGSFSRGNTSQPGSLDRETADPLSTRWREPPEKPTGGVTLWVVVRDGRGGTGWERRSVVFE